tara:strand:- start:102 stop:638 length:537 start_codon:yes stop_codon:yes gene_type:complete
MKKTVIFLSVVLLNSLFVSCNKQQSLQSYLIESQEKEGFMSVDVPLSFIQLKTEGVPEEIKESYKSIRKVNLAGLPYKNNEEAYEIEKTLLSSILKNSNSYKSLMRMDVKGMKLAIYCNGDSDSIDEVIAFGHSKEVGVGVARILGKNMNPGKIMEMIEYLKIDLNQFNLQQFNLSFK